MRALCLFSCFGTHYRHFARPARMRALCLFRCFGTPLRGEGLRPLLLVAGGEAGDIAVTGLVARSFGAIRAPLPCAAHAERVRQDGAFYAAAISGFRPMMLCMFSGEKNSETRRPSREPANLFICS